MMLVGLIELEMERFHIAHTGIIEQRVCYGTFHHFHHNGEHPYCSFRRFPYQTEWNVESIVMSMQ